MDNEVKSIPIPWDGSKTELANLLLGSLELVLQYKITLRSTDDPFLVAAKLVNWSLGEPWD